MAVKWICGDAMQVLPQYKDKGAIVTSLPDAHEIGLSINDWIEWFQEAVAACILNTHPTAPTIFYQTDRKAESQTVSKAELVLNQAHDMDVAVVWHKIALRVSLGKTDLYRPGFTHMIALSRRVNGNRPVVPVGKAFPDVFDHHKALYRDGMNPLATEAIIKFASRYHTTIIDPFCGRGTVPIIASGLGLDAIGIDIDPSQVAFGKSLQGIPDLFR